MRVSASVNFSPKMTEGGINMKDTRPNKIEYYLGIAEMVAKRGTCLRRNFGAVVVNDDQIISTGYTGAPRGAKNCIGIGSCYRIEKKIPEGERYELCRSVHAEMNAIIHASRRQLLNGTLYLVGLSIENNEYVENAEPCKLCKRLIINSGISEVFIRKGKGSSFKMKVKDWIKNEKEWFSLEAAHY